jgi:uncharacterized protein (DUF433 family)
MRRSFWGNQLLKVPESQLFILELLGNGWTYEQVLDNYPQLERGDIEAALMYAAEVLQDELVYTIP